MSNFTKRFIISLLAFPLIYILLYQKYLFNILIIITFLFCIYEWVNLFSKKGLLLDIFGLIILLIFLISYIKDL